MICRYTCFFTACIIMAYEALHTKGFVYRDMKPANVLIKDDGYAGDLGHVGLGSGLGVRDGYTCDTGLGPGSGVTLFLNEVSRRVFAWLSIG